MISATRKPWLSFSVTWALCGCFTDGGVDADEGAGTTVMATRQVALLGGLPPSVALIYVKTTFLIVFEYLRYVLEFYFKMYFRND